MHKFFFAILFFLSGTGCFALHFSSPDTVNWNLLEANVEAGLNDIQLEYQGTPFSGVAERRQNGVRVWLAHFQNGIQQGEELTWAGPQKKLISRGNYKNGERHGKWFLDCNGVDQDGCVFLGGQAGSIVAEYKEGRRTGRWEMKNMYDEVFYVDFVRLGYQGFVERHVTLASTGDTLYKDIRPEDEFWRAHPDALPMEALLFRDQSHRFFQTGSFGSVPQVALQQHPRANYFFENQPFSGTVVDFHENGKLKLQASVVDGQLNRWKYFNAQGNQVKGFQDEQQKQRNLAKVRKAPEKYGFITLKQAFSVAKDACKKADPEEVIAENGQLMMRDPAEFYYLFDFSSRDKKGRKRTAIIHVSAKGGFLSKVICNEK